MSEKWIDVCVADELPDNDVKSIQTEGCEIALYLVDGEVFATDNVCSHGNARLCDGYLEGHEIECPLHQGRFDTRNGKAMCAPLTVDIRVYPVKIDNGRVLVAVP